MRRRPLTRGPRTRPRLCGYGAEKAREAVGVARRSGPGAVRDVRSTLALVILTIYTAVVFDFTNGFHDTANAMATTIATRALRPGGVHRHPHVDREAGAPSSA